MEHSQIDRNRWSQQKGHAKERGIGFKLTFEQWWDIWQQSGYYHLRGKNKDSYVMSRYGDIGAYADEAMKEGWIWEPYQEWKQRKEQE